MLNILSGLGGAVLVFGLIKLELSATLVGTCVILMGKSWFLDRMVWLFEEMMDECQEYREWLY